MFDLLLIQPIYQASWITGTALNGMLFFQEYVDFNYTQWVMVRPLHPSASCTLTASPTTLLVFYRTSSSFLDVLVLTPVLGFRQFPFGVLLTVAGVASLAARHSAQSVPPSPTRYLCKQKPDHGDQGHQDGLGDSTIGSNYPINMSTELEVRPLTK